MNRAWIAGAAVVGIGLAVLLQFNETTIWIGVASLLLVAAYPFMKRVTYWPQAWLGLTFNWGVLVGWAAMKQGLDPAALLVHRQQRRHGVGHQAGQLAVQLAHLGGLLHVAGEEDEARRGPLAQQRAQICGHRGALESQDEPLARAALSIRQGGGLTDCSDAMKRHADPITLTGRY